MARTEANRRSACGGRVFCLAALLLATARAPAAAECQLTIARLKYHGGGDWYANPSSLPNLITAVRLKAGAVVCDTGAVVEIMDDRFFRYPFAYMTGHGNVHFTHEERLRLRSYLIGGGFLWADDNYGLDKPLRREMAALFPENPLTPLEENHPVFTKVHRLPGLPKIHEHDGEPAQAFGVFWKGRMVVLYTYSSDIGDGMEDLDVHNDGPRLHELALQMGVNVVAWFLDP